MQSQPTTPITSVQDTTDTTSPLDISVSSSTIAGLSKLLSETNLDSHTLSTDAQSTEEVIHQYSASMMPSEDDGAVEVLTEIVSEEDKTTVPGSSTTTSQTNTTSSRPIQSPSRRNTNLTVDTSLDKSLNEVTSLSTHTSAPLDEDCIREEQDGELHEDRNHMTMGHVVTAQLTNCINEASIADMLYWQNQTLMTTIDTRERLKAFNEYASARYQELYKSYEQHTTLLHQLRKDLDSIFKRIRTLKKLCRQRYPEANQLVRQKYPPGSYLVEDDEDWEPLPTDEVQT